MSAPRLRCHERTRDTFYGSYKGHEVGIERDSRADRWTFLVIGPDGIRAADGITRDRCTMREAIVHALTGAQLYTPTP